MFRFLYSTLDFFATAFVLMSPVAVLHWLFRAMGAKELEELVKPLNGFFDPLNAMLSMVVQVPPMEWGGKEISMTQAALAAIFTVLFFVLTTCSNIIKAGEQRLTLSTNTLKQQLDKQKQAKAKQSEQKKNTENRRVLIYVAFHFEEEGTVAELLNRYTGFEGRLYKPLPIGWLLEFQSLEKALNYCVESAQMILSHYAKLRPMDPHPPFKMVLHAIHQEETPESGLQKCLQMVSYTGNNQMLLSTEVKALIDANNLNFYKIQSMGDYEMTPGRSQEIFLLHSQRVR
jgi:hypothetical protein